ncbi:DUF2490 domain-containing protein [Sphingobium baderi]|uniref:DUF2490 domain-containing protein n=1 Tax=Sphingobium baderi LL03 TaxID=1114964 RepID=T0HHZ8_9SPHN|nr:DUF2490 domain-containing protein [Sphingobium baderi]EQA98994.1 hypothetical protein L485_15680 [Sphingobium baderi LL03]KMS61546.1 hypothetical protein V475_14760 [Sphingobium baderi LL03]WRD75142.1 DUF2490 domain-containing protein [Sphingobium baderi]
MPFFARPRMVWGVFLSLGLPTAPPALAAREENQAWITESVAIRASETDIVTLDMSQRFRRAESDDEQALFRLALDHRVARGVLVGGGIAYVEGKAEEEMRLFQQVTLNQGIWLARTRLEQRLFDTADRASWRLRQRVQASVPVDRDKRWALVGAMEVFFHLNRARPSDKSGLAAMRHQIGLRHAVGKAMDVQLLYMRQQNFRDHRPDAVAHVPWLTLAWKI